MDNHGGRDEQCCKPITDQQAYSGDDMSMRVLNTVVLAVVLSACDRTSRVTYLTERSSAGYQLRLAGGLHTKPWMEFVSEVIRAELVSPAHGKSFEIFRADRRDSTFRQEFPTEAWISPTVMRFSSSTKSHTAGARSVQVVNAAESRLDLLTVECGDLILAFHVDQRDGLRVDCPIFDWIAVRGHFVNGRSTEERVFTVPATKAPVLIVVREGGAELQR
jgi:hypothetical protein